MLTVKKLISELSKFNDDDECYAYEGEVTGIIIQRDGFTGQGIIYCSEGDDIEIETKAFNS